MRDHLSPMEKVVFIVLFLAGAILLFSHVGNYYLWGDEGETALLGRNILRYGLPYGFDGRNLYEFRGGLCLNGSLLPAFTPWLQFYWAAGSMVLFGESTFGARALFVVAGLFSMVVYYLFVLGYFRNVRLALISLALMATSVPTLLFLRQCRYYALVMLLSTAIALLYTRYEEKWRHLALACLLFLLFFFANPLVAIPALAAMAISFYLFDNRRKALHFFLAPMPAVLSVIGAFFFWMYQRGLPDRPDILMNIHPRDFSRLTWLYFKDYNLAQLLPLGLVAMLAVLWIQEGLTEKNGDRRRIRREWSIISFVFAFTIILSTLSPQASSTSHSDIRYAAPIFPFLLLIAAITVERIYRWQKGLAYFLLPFIIFTNLLTYSPARSYIYEYVREIAGSHDNSVKAAVRFLRQYAGRDEIILVIPNHMLGSMEFYLGGKLLFCDVIGEDNKNLLADGVKLPRYTYSPETVPDWIVLFGLSVDLPRTQRRLERLDLGAYEKYPLPVFGPDVSRPELFWRSFRPVTDFRPDQGLIILRRIRK